MSDEEFYEYFKTLIPKGIYYETQKRRWRVRLYKEGNVVYLRYFKSYERAFAAYDDAKNTQQQSTSTKTEKLNLRTSTTSDLLDSLKLL